MALLAASSSLYTVSFRSAQASATAPCGTHTARVAAAAPASPSPPLTSLTALQCGPTNHVSLSGSALAGTLFAALASSDSAVAAQEMMNLAVADDNRGLVLLLTLAPAIGWVLFNILQPALDQFDRMKSAKGLAAGLGLGAAASLLLPRHAEAMAQEIATLAADNDPRGLLLLIVLAPAVGWVLFNILKPGLNQLDKMKASKGILGAVALSGALLLSAAQADAAVQEVARLADGIEPASSDARGLLLIAALVPALGWVLFNILQPAINQFDRMKASKGIAAAVGLGAAGALLPLRADAFQELATVADNDSRGTLLLAVLIPAIGWVLFNILQPALNQFDKMKAQK